MGCRKRFVLERNSLAPSSQTAPLRTQTIGLEMRWFHYAFDLESHLTWGPLGGGFCEGTMAVPLRMLMHPGPAQTKPSSARRSLCRCFSGMYSSLSLGDEGAGWHLSRFVSVGYRFRHDMPRSPSITRATGRQGLGQAKAPSLGKPW